jgi:hypothetical protein
MAKKSLFVAPNILVSLRRAMNVVFDSFSAIYLANVLEKLPWPGGELADFLRKQFLSFVMQLSR